MSCSLPLQSLITRWDRVKSELLRATLLIESLWVFCLSAPFTDGLTRNFINETQIRDAQLLSTVISFGTERLEIERETEGGVEDVGHKTEELVQFSPL